MKSTLTQRCIAPLSLMPAFFPSSKWLVKTPTLSHSSIRIFHNLRQNSLFNSALKQSSSVRRDLDAFAEAPTTSSAALQGPSITLNISGIATDFLSSGQIAASLTSLSRTLDEYADLSKKELIPARQEKAQERIKSFRADLLDYRQSFECLRKDREEIVSLPPTLTLCSNPSSKALR